MATALALAAGSVQAALNWNWSYSGAGIMASGTLTTTDTADGSGFYEILSISGNRNGIAITGLYPTGASIPGNEPYLPATT